MENRTLYRSIGTLNYGDGKLVLTVDQELSDYYRSLIPRWIRTNKQMYPAHVSVVRKETPPRMNFWGKHEGEQIEFLYSNVVRWSATYYWLDVWSKRLEDIRVELGLPVDSPYTRPPDGLAKTFHCTIGNLKGL